MTLFKLGVFMGGLGILIFAGCEAYAVVCMRKEINSLK